MDGIPVETIQKALNTQPIQEALQNYDALWPSSKIIFEAFMANPAMYRKSMRKKGLLYSLTQKATR